MRSSATSRTAGHLVVAGHRSRVGGSARGHRAPARGAARFWSSSPTPRPSSTPIARPSALRARPRGQGAAAIRQLASLQRVCRTPSWPAAKCRLSECSRDPWLLHPRTAEDFGLLDLTDRLRADGLDKRLVAIAPHVSGRRAGAFYALPHDVHPVMLAYRRDLVEALGIDVSKLTTWDKFVEVGRR